MKPIIIRIFSLIANFLINLHIVKIILNENNVHSYIFYSLLTTIPNFLPFADFGLGANLFLLYAGKREFEKIKHKVSELFSLIIFTSSIQCFIFSILILCLGPNIFKSTENIEFAVLYSILIICITFLAVPLSLASKKLLATERLSELLVFQSLIPSFTLFYLFFLMNLNSRIPMLYVLSPALSYLTSNFLIFIRSNISKEIELKRINFQSLKMNFKETFSISFSSLLFVTYIGSCWLVPKYIASLSSQNDFILNYSIFLLYYLPALSILQIPGQKMSPILVSNTRVYLNNFKQNFYIVIVLSFLIDIFFVLLRVFQHDLDFVFPNEFFSLLFLILMPISSLWIFPIYSISERKEFTFVLKVSFVCMLFALYFMTMLENFDFEIRLVFYLLVTNIGLLLGGWISIFSIRRRMDQAK